MRSNTYLGITTLISHYEVRMEYRDSCIWWTACMAAPKYNSEMANWTAIYPGYFAKYDPKSEHKSLTINADTVNHEVVHDWPWMEEQSLIEGDDSSQIATTPRMYNYHTGSAVTKHSEIFSQIQNTNSGLHTQGSDGKHTSRFVEKPHVQVSIPNKILTQSWQSQDTLLL